jgi:hypothetical protein
MSLSIQDRLRAHMGKAEIPDVLPDCREAADTIDTLVNALRNARNYIDAVVINTPDRKKRRNYAECLRIIEDALKPVGGNSFEGDDGRPPWEERLPPPLPALQLPFDGLANDIRRFLTLGQGGLDALFRPFREAGRDLLEIDLGSAHTRQYR